MSYFHALILGIIEGVTEFLPISSTGHMILAGSALKIPTTDFLKSFEIIIQLGAILSVVVLYWKKFWEREVLARLIVAFIPTGILGLIFYKIIKKFLLANEPVVLWSLFLGGIFLIVFELVHKEKPEATEEIKNISYKHAALLGVFQSIAMIPGVSRSAATIVGGLSMGLKRKTIVEFSFLLAVPTMLAASVLDLYKNASSFSVDQIGVLALGFVVAFLVAIGVIKWLLKYIRNHSFIGFGVYRIIIALLFWMIIF